MILPLFFLFESCLFSSIHRQREFELLPSPDGPDRAEPERRPAALDGRTVPRGERSALAEDAIEPERGGLPH